MVNAGEAEVFSCLFGADYEFSVEMEIEAIGYVETCYDEKFGVPRQPRLVENAWGRVIFDKAYRGESFLRGIEGFSHLWLVFQFHQANQKHGRGTVRPPRLGGNERRGVFATRAPFRPNGMGLSAVELVGVDYDHADGPVLNLRGVDLVSGTPLLDIKPYVPFSDSIEEAIGGFVSGEPERMEVHWDCESELSIESQNLISETLSLDPRPAYQQKEGREYGCQIDGVNVRWLVKDGVCHVIKITNE